MMFSAIIAVAFPITEMTHVADINLALELELVFYFLVMAMICVDSIAICRYEREIRLVTSINLVSPFTVHIFPRYKTFDNHQPLYRERPPPNRPLARVQELPGNLQVAGLKKSSCILSDGEGGIIFVQNVTGAVLSTFQARTVEETKVVWITADAIRRNPLNPEVLVLTETEISQLDFGNERETMRQALRY